MTAVTLTDLLQSDIVSAARRRLLTAFNTDDTANAGSTQWWLTPGGLIGKDGQDGSDPGPWYEGWVFPGVDNDGRPLRSVEGSNKVSVTITDRDTWGVNQNNSMRMPLLRVLIFADTARQPDGNPAGRYADLRCRKTAEFIIKLFDDVSNSVHLWNPGQPEELSIVSCVVQSGLSIQDIPDNDYAVRGSFTLAVAL